MLISDHLSPKTPKFPSDINWHLAVKNFYLKVRGHASEDMKMDSVMSSKTWRRNSALAQASVVDSILFGFNSQDWWRDSMILKNQNK